MIQGSSNKKKKAHKIKGRTKYFGDSVETYRRLKWWNFSMLVFVCNLKTDF